MLRVSADRIRLYGGALVAIGFCAALIAPMWHLDWIVFRAGGAAAGTASLLQPPGGTAYPFAYPPAVAWLFYPAAHLPIDLGFDLNALLMLAMCAVAGVLGSRVYGLPIGFALLATFAWVPATQAGFLGQFTPVGLVLSLVAIGGISRGNQLMSGLAAGLLLYKPPDAIALWLLLIVRRQWRAVGVAAGIGLLWYIASVAATGGDWAWPVHYLGLLSAYYSTDFARNVLKVVSLPGLLLAARLPSLAAIIAGVALLAAAAARFAKIPALEAASMAPLVGLAASPHAYMYETVLVLPALFYTMTHVVEPWRTRTIVAAYTIAPLWVLGPWIRFDPLAIVVVGGSALWLVSRS